VEASYVILDKSKETERNVFPFLTTFFLSVLQFASLKILDLRRKVAFVGAKEESVCAR
jgi:hypothetical protein